MDIKISKASTVNLVGGRICLDFLNTADWHGTNEPVEFLTDYGELLKWADHAGILGKKELLLLEGQHTERPAEAKRVYKSAITLREAMLRIFYALQKGEDPQAGDLGVFNTALSKTMKHILLEPQAGKFNWQWQANSLLMDQVLWPIVKDAAELFTSELLPRVSRCGDERCGWLFLDTSRNKSRRWCDMKDCGNRAKVKRHYRKSNPDR